MPQAKSLFVAIVFLGFLSRALPHPHNFTPILAMALVAGAYASRAWIGMLLPLLAMLLSDLVLNNTLYAHYYEGFAGLQPILDNGFTYIAIAVLALLPLLLPAEKRESWTGLGALGLGGSVLFFLISNFGVWLTSGMYPKTLVGLQACYAAGVPFFPATLASTALYGAVALAALKGFGVSRNELADTLAR